MHFIKILVYPLALAISLVLAMPAYADSSSVCDEMPEYCAGFIVEPMEVKLKLIAGELYSGSFTIKNVTEKDLVIGATILPHTIIDGGNMSDFQTMTSRTEIVNWTSITHGASSSIDLKAGETRTIGFIIDVPSGAEAGKQMEIVILKPTTPNEYGYVNQVGFTISATIIERTEPLNITIISLCMVSVVMICLLVACVYIALFSRSKNHKIKS